jgi:hypothetical protein
LVKGFTALAEKIFRFGDLKSATEALLTFSLAFVI